MGWAKVQTGNRRNPISKRGIIPNLRYFGPPGFPVVSTDCNRIAQQYKGAKNSAGA
jgi:hypothetical protein